MLQVTITPHVAALSMAADVVPVFVQNLKHFAAREPLVFRVDIERGY